VATGGGPSQQQHQQQKPKQQQGTANGTSSSSSSSSPSIELLFMAHADRPSSPYAESSVRVDYIQLPSPIGSSSSGSNNNLNASSSSHQQQSTTVPAMTAAGWQLTEMPWFDNPFSMATATHPSAGTNSSSGSSSAINNSNRRFMTNSSNQTFLGWWTYPYYLCSSRRWLLTYSIPVHQQLQTRNGDRYILF